MITTFVQFLVKIPWQVALYLSREDYKWKIIFVPRGEMNLEDDRGYLAIPCSYFECFTKFIHTIILLNDWTEVVCYTTTNEISPSGQGLGCNTIIDFTENKSEGID